MGNPQELLEKVKELKKDRKHKLPFFQGAAVPPQGTSRRNSSSSRLPPVYDQASLALPPALPYIYIVSDIQHSTRSAWPIPIGLFFSLYYPSNIVGGEGQGWKMKPNTMHAHDGEALDQLPSIPPIRLGTEMAHISTTYPPQTTPSQPTNQSEALDYIALTNQRSNVSVCMWRGNSFLAQGAGDSKLGVCISLRNLDNGTAASNVGAR